MEKSFFLLKEIIVNQRNRIKNQMKNKKGQENRC